MCIENFTTNQWVKKLFIFIFYWAIHPSIAQITQPKVIDSLENWIAKYPKKDTIWISNLSKLELLYVDSRSPKKNKLGFTILEESKKLGYKRGIAKGLRLLAYQYAEAGNYVKSLDLALEKLALTQKMTSVDMIDSYNILIYIYATSGNNEKALEYSELAMAKLKEMPQDRKEWFGLYGNVANALANMYTLTGNKSKALVQFQEILKVMDKAMAQKQMNDMVALYMQGVAYSNMSFLYNEQKEYTQSAIYAEKALALTQKYNVSLLLPPVLNTLVSSYTNLKKYNEAEKNLAKVKDFYDKNELQIDEISSYFQVGRDLYLAQNKYKEAYEFQNKYITLKDSTQNKEVQNKLNDLSIKYETKQKEQANLLLKAQNAQISTQKQNYLILSISAILLLLISIFFYTKLRKNNQLLKDTNELKDKLFSIIAHDLKRPANTFQNAMRTLNFLIKNKQHEKLLALGAKTEVMATDMNLMIDNIFRWSLTEQGNLTINMTNFEIEPMLRDLKEEFNEWLLTKNLEVVFMIEQNSTIYTDRTILPIILRNLLSNAIKFSPENDKIILAYSENTQKHIVSVTDHGIGIPEELKGNLLHTHTQVNRNGLKGEKGMGMGLYICNTLAQNIQASIEIHSALDKGSIFAIHIPKKA